MAGTEDLTVRIACGRGAPGSGSGPTPTPVPVPTPFKSDEHPAVQAA
jgi:hypothetical protein